LIRLNLLPLRGTVLGKDEKGRGGFGKVSLKGKGGGGTRNRQSMWLKRSVQIIRGKKAGLLKE